MPLPADARRVLVIDDEMTIRIAMRRYFTRLGWRVEEAANGENALRMLLDDAKLALPHRYAVVLSDLRMPGINGIQLYERLRLEYPEVLRRLIFSTGDTVSEEAAEFVSSTECVVIQKPFELATLRATIERVIADAEG